MSSAWRAAPASAEAAAHDRGQRATRGKRSDARRRAVSPLVALRPEIGKGEGNAPDRHAPRARQRASSSRAAGTPLPPVRRSSRRLPRQALQRVEDTRARPRVSADSLHSTRDPRGGRRRARAGLQEGATRRRSQRLARKSGTTSTSMGAVAAAIPGRHGRPAPRARAEQVVSAPASRQSLRNVSSARRLGRSGRDRQNHAVFRPASFRERHRARTASRRFTRSAARAISGGRNDRGGARRAGSRRSPRRGIRTGREDGRRLPRPARDTGPCGGSPPPSRAPGRAGAKRLSPRSPQSPHAGSRPRLRRESPEYSDTPTRARRRPPPQKRSRSGWEQA